MVAYVRVRCEQAVSGGHEIVQRSLKVGLAEAESMGSKVPRDDEFKAKIPAQFGEDSAGLSQGGRG